MAKKPDPNKHNDIRIPDEDIRKEKDSPSFNEALKKITEHKEDAERPEKPVRGNKKQ